MSTPAVPVTTVKPNKFWAILSAVGEKIRQIDNVVANVATQNLTQIKALNPVAASIAAQFAMGQSLIDAKYAAVDATGVTGAKKFEEVFEAVGPIVLEELAQAGLAANKEVAENLFNSYSGFAASLANIPAAAASAPDIATIEAAEAAAGLTTSA